MRADRASAGPRFTYLFRENAGLFTIYAARSFRGPVRWENLDAGFSLRSCRESRDRGRRTVSFGAHAAGAPRRRRSRPRSPPRRVPRQERGRSRPRGDGGARSRARDGGSVRRDLARRDAPRHRWLRGLSSSSHDERGPRRHAHRARRRRRADRRPRDRRRRLRSEALQPARAPRPRARGATSHEEGRVSAGARAHRGRRALDRRARPRDLPRPEAHHAHVVRVPLARRARPSRGGDHRPRRARDPAQGRHLRSRRRSLARQKLEKDPKDPKLIKTIRGIGYVLVRPADRS